MVFSHAFAGATLTHLAVNSLKEKFTGRQVTILYFGGIVASILPDFDILLIFFDNTTTHRDLLSHSFIPYLIITLVVWGYAHLKGNKYLSVLSWVFLLGVFSHLFLDVVAGGVVFLAPFTYRIIGFPMYFPSKPAHWATAYVASKYMVWEVIIFALYLYVIRGTKSKILIGLPFFFLLVASITFIVVFFRVLT